MRTSARVSRARHGRGGLLLGWCLWLLGSWLVLFWNGGWTVPNIRLMLLSAVIGFMGVWPAVRLSQPTERRTRDVPRAGEERRQPRRPRRLVPMERPAAQRGADDVPVRAWGRACGGVWLDWVCMFVVFQAVLWPLRLAGDWSWTQTLWLDTAVAGWSLLTGLLIAWGRGTNHGGWRVIAMVACVSLVVLEPALWWVAAQRPDGPPVTLQGFVRENGSDADGAAERGDGDPPALGQGSRWDTSGASGGDGGWMRVSPLQTMWVLTTPGSGVIDDGHDNMLDAAPTQPYGGTPFLLARATVVSVTLAALTGWLVLWLLIVGRRLTELGSVAVRAPSADGPGAESPSRGV